MLIALLILWIVFWCVVCFWRDIDDAIWREIFRGNKRLAIVVLALRRLRDQ
jgi:hypothetical protein